MNSINLILESLYESKTRNCVQAKSTSLLFDTLYKEMGLKLDAADRHYIEASKSFNDEKVVMYKDDLYDKNAYVGTFNRYYDGGVEIINIHKAKSGEV